MRERIDALRKERVVFDVIYRQLELDIKQRREELISMMQKTEKAERARDEAKAEVEKMRADAARFKELFQQEWRDVVEKNLKEQNDVTLTSVHPPGTAETTMLRTAGTHGRNASARNPHEQSHGHSDYATKLRSIVARAAWSIARDTGYIHVSLQKVQQYEEALATVKEAIGMNASLQEVVERFQQTEAQNYSLYNYVSELNSESEQLTEEIQDF